MTSKEEIESEIKSKIEARYGEGAVINIFHEELVNNKGEKTGVHHWIVKYLDSESNIIKIDHDIYADTDADGKLHWRMTNPLTKYDVIATQQTFSQTIQEKINEMINKGTIIYGEIINVNEDAKRARVFLKTETEESIYIVWLDENNNLQKIETTFDR